MHKIFTALYERFFKTLPAESRIVTEIKCTPTFWRFVDDKGRSLDWDMSESIQLVDNKKVNKLVQEYQCVKYPGLSALEIATKTSWAETEKIIDHIYAEHFNEIKLERPKNVVIASVDCSVTVAGIKCLLTGEEKKYNASRCVIEGDVLIHFIRFIDWDIIDKIMDKEPA